MTRYTSVIQIWMKANQIIQVPTQRSCERRRWASKAAKLSRSSEHTQWKSRRATRENWRLMPLLWSCARLWALTVSSKSASRNMTLILHRRSTRLQLLSLLYLICFYQDLCTARHRNKATRRSLDLDFQSAAWSRWRINTEKIAGKWSLLTMTESHYWKNAQQLVIRESCHTHILLEVLTLGKMFCYHNQHLSNMLSQRLPPIRKPWWCFRAAYCCYPVQRLSQNDQVYSAALGVFYPDST